jgi:hypothetical protein
MRKMTNKFLKNFGYMLVKSSLGQGVDGNYLLYRYMDRNGNFDYEKYKRIQTEGNNKKIGLVWVKEENIQFLSEYIKNKIESPGFGICHGTRRGMEQQWFAKYLGCNVIGTEISDTAVQFPNTIQWDFHQVKPEWLNAVDFIYSNSFDHSFNPEECINAWMSCLKKDGICIIEHTSGHGISGASELDPFGADLAILPYLILKWGKGKFAVRDVLEAPAMPGGISDSHFVCIQNN